MTMNREAKEKLQIKVYRIGRGLELVRYHSPKLIKERGEFVPRDQAKRIEAGRMRNTQRRSRESVVLSRIEGRRKVGTRRVV